MDNFHSNVPSRLNQYRLPNLSSYLGLYTPMLQPADTACNYFRPSSSLPIKTQVRLFSSITHTSDEQHDKDESKDNTVMSPSLTHVDPAGHARMVDVGNKPISQRTASAVGKVLLGKTAFQLVQDNKISKGDVLTVAQIAGIMSAKRTSDLIPLCHNIPITKVDLSLELRPDDLSVEITSSVKTSGVTGVEMEALTAVSVAALTVYDMCKAVTHDIVIRDVKLVSKTGGQRGDFKRTK